MILKLFISDFELRYIFADGFVFLLDLKVFDGPVSCFARLWGNRVGGGEM